MKTLVYYIISLTVIFTFLGFAFPDSYNLYQGIAQGSMLFLFFISVFRFLTRGIALINIFRVWLYMIILFAISLCFFPDYTFEAAVGDLKELVIPAVVAFIGYQLLTCSDKQLRLGLSCLAVFAAICAVSIILNTGGITILQQYRQDVFKNQTSPVFAQISLICVALFIRNKVNKQVKIILIISGLVCFSFCVINRARTATLSCLVITAYLLWEKYGSKIFRYLPIAIILCCFVFYDNILEIFKASFIGTGSVHTINDLSSGRVERNEASIEFISENPIFGAIEEPYIWTNFLVPHFYILWKLVKYGLLFAAPFLVVYFKLAITVYKNAKRNWLIWEVPAACLLLAYITSFAEYSSPFGPGTSYVICYLLVGRAFAMQQYKRGIRYHYSDSRSKTRMI